ncbi:MAG: molybdopterin molybdotransferase [Gaiellales bacterium]|nr:molybdopterin molybdotransferase [Gaiellales bacterium]
MAPDRLLQADEACALLLAACVPLPSERLVPGPAAVGRVLAELVGAALDLPPFPSSAMDGYAVRAAEAGTPLPIAFRAAAGDDPPALPTRSAAGITTGGVVPDGADAVVPVERAVELDGVVRFEGPDAEGDHIRVIGSDLRRGDEVLPAGVPIVPLALAALSAAGIAEIAVHRRPRVAVVVTGDELRTPPEPLRRGQIYESNGSFLAARSSALGAELVGVERVADDAAATRAAFARALERADLVLASGGVSVGPHDHVKPALRDLGVRELFWRIALQPGKPAWAGEADGRLVIALPGNPLSVLAGFELLVRPALRRLSGMREPVPPRLRLPLSEAVRRLPDRMRAVPSVIETSSVRPLGAGLSHQLGRAALADALALVPAGAEGAPPGELVDVLSLA